MDGSGNLFIANYLGLIRKVSSNGIITTIAGNETEGYSGDGGPATGAQLSNPSGVAVDTAGNLYIADLHNNRIRKVSTSGTITTVAGTGGPGCTDSGDGGPATSAQLCDPYGVAVDPSGNLFIAESTNNRIRKVSSNGIINTVAGNGTAGYSGDGGPATGAHLSGPAGVALDPSGNLFIADNANNRIRKVSSNGIITTIAGNGTASYSGDGGPATSAQLSGPYGVAVDASGNLLVADSQNNRIRKVSSSGIITTIAGYGTAGYSGDGGPATSAQLWDPLGVAVDASGNLLVAEYQNNRIRKVSSSGIITTIAGNGTAGYSGDGGPATSAQLWGPLGVAVDASGDLFIADLENDRIRKVSASGIITTIAGNGTPGYSGDGGPATSAQLWNPLGVAVDASGDLFIADRQNDRIRKVLPNGIITTVAGNGISGYSGDGGPAIDAELDFLIGVAVDASGDLFIADAGNGVIRKVSPSGIIATIAGNGTLGFSGDGGPATSAQLGSWDLAVDGAGNIYVSDGANNTVRLLKPSASAPSPTINANGVVDGAGFRVSVSPGGIASAFGTNFASSAAYASGIPLQQTLGGAYLAVGSSVAPQFYVSPTQINFQIPWELSGQTQASVIATTGAGSSTAQTLSLSAVAPGIFTVSSSGSGQGAVTIAATGQLAGAATPAPRGQYVTICCSGLGAVFNTPATGAAALANPLSNTLLTPTVTIAGAPATVVQFSGLTPGLVGLYQVNALVPTTVAPGSAVSLVVTIGGVSSNTVTIAVQ